MTDSLDRRRFLQALAAVSAAPLASLANAPHAAAGSHGGGRPSSCSAPAWPDLAPPTTSCATATT